MRGFYYPHLDKVFFHDPQTPARASIWIAWASEESPEGEPAGVMQRIRPIRDNLRVGSDEFLMWRMYAERCCLAWNLLLYAASVSGLKKSVGPAALADAVERKGQLHIAREIRWQFGLLTAKEYNAPTPMPISAEMPSPAFGESDSLFD